MNNNFKNKGNMETIEKRRESFWIGFKYCGDNDFLDIYKLKEIDRLAYDKIINHEYISEIAAIKIVTEVSKFAELEKTLDIYEEEYEYTDGRCIIYKHWYKMQNGRFVEIFGGCDCSS